MPIDFDSEITEIASKLSQVDGYLDCEKIIVHNIKKQLANGFNDENITRYLKKISDWLAEKIGTYRYNTECSNYRYASVFVDTLLIMPYWKSWMKATDN